jgi:hypothetical protein
VPRPGTWLVVLAVLLLLGAAALALWPSARRASFSGALSTHRADALGAKALFEVFERVGSRPERLRRDPLQPKEGGTLFFLGPESLKAPLPGLRRAPTFDRPTTTAVERFVHRGGRIVVVSDRTTALHRELGVKVTDAVDSTGRPLRDSARRPRPALEVAQRASHILTQRAQRLAARRFFHLSTRAPNAATLFVHGGRPVAIAIPHGAGDAVFVSAPSFASNAFLGHADNLSFLYELATTAPAPGPLQFDETRHGVRQRRGLAALAAQWKLEGAAAQASLAALLLLWAGARRIRARRVHTPKSRHDTRDQISATASLYARGRLTGHALRQIAAALVRDTAARAHTRDIRSLDDLAGHLRARGDVVAAERSLALAHTLAGAGERPTPRVLLDFARRVGSLRRHLAASSPKEPHP